MPQFRRSPVGVGGGRARRLLPPAPHARTILGRLRACIFWHH